MDGTRLTKIRCNKSRCQHGISLLDHLFHFIGAFTIVEFYFRRFDIQLTRSAKKNLMPRWNLLKKLINHSLSIVYLLSRDYGNDVGIKFWCFDFDRHSTNGIKTVDEFMHAFRCKTDLGIFLKKNNSSKLRQPGTL